MSWTNPNAPNLADYTSFLQGTVGIPDAVMPSNSPYIGYALNRALDLVINAGAAVSGNDYTLAVYNCAAHIQLVITPDVIVNGVSRNWFDTARSQFGLLKTVNGVVTSSSDQGTSTANAVSEGLTNLTIEDLGFMKTNWGRAYVGFNQSYGPTVWGLS